MDDNPSSITTTVDQEEQAMAENIVHYAFGSASQMDAVQEEVILANGSTITNNPGDSQLVSNRNCNPVVKEDTQCHHGDGTVLEETIVTDTQHNEGNGADLMMIMDLDEDDDEDPFSVLTPVNVDEAAGAAGLAPSTTNTTSNNADIASISCIEATATAATASDGIIITTNDDAQTQLPLLSHVLPLVKIVVPNAVGCSSTTNNKIIMKIQVKEPPDVSQPAQDDLASANGVAESDEDETMEEEQANAKVTEIVAATTTMEVVEAGGKSTSSSSSHHQHVKVPREMKQLQKMVDSSKVLTDFMASTSTAITTSTPVSNNNNNKVRKSRKGGVGGGGAVGRPKKRVGGQESSPSTTPVDHESPKRQSARALAAMEAAQKRRMFAEINLDTTTTGDESQEHQLGSSGVYDAGDEISMDIMDPDGHSDNETNESVASGGTDSATLLQMMMPTMKVQAAKGRAAAAAGIDNNSSSSAIAAIVPAPKVSGVE